ncbi:hypothetical protein [Deinococcus geothermalis]|uniref:Uncharacterized protein n=1 Tax=Deinococcus geothermalis (strain DSM 11300 / CIP 105573 / AG-3a) TaxID=319795 RepID=Q1IYN3_DEIGD|nr:hypothetical protein [Deinococcus geothermalis]ABF45651.1 hypothetical protein Dgeo_1356 [Deinococcus geothermalis DSM 11300]
MKTIHRMEDIPKFKSQAEEARFWDTHQLAPELWAEGQRGDPELDKAMQGLVSVKVVPSRAKSKPRAVKRTG